MQSGKRPIAETIEAGHLKDLTRSSSLGNTLDPVISSRSLSKNIFLGSAILL